MCRCADMCPRARSIVEAASSSEAAAAISSAYNVLGCSRAGKDAYYNMKLEVAQVVYKHKLRDLKTAYPGEFCGFSEGSFRDMVEWTICLEAAGITVPATVCAARKIRFNLKAAVADVSKYAHD